MCFRRRLASSEGSEIQGGEIGSNTRPRIPLFRLTLHGGLRALLARARRARRADCGRRAFDIGATRARAGRALTTLLFTGRIIYNDRLRRRNAALQHILGKVGYGRALRL